jgi:hypothetical protein
MSVNFNHDCITIILTTAPILLCFSVVSVVYLSGRGLCDGLITRPEESYRLCCVTVCDLETSRTRRLRPASGL